MNGSSLEKHINGPPRGPELGGRKSNAVYVEWGGPRFHAIELVSRSNAIVAGNRSGGEPNAQSRGGPGGVTPPTTKEQYEGTMPDSPTSTVSSTQDAAWGPNQGRSMIATVRNLTGDHLDSPVVRRSPP